MGYVVKHSTSNVDKTRRKGNVALGVSSEGYDKTATSGFYAGVPPVEGKHNFVRTSATGDPNFYCVDDTELINFVNSIGGSVLTTLEAKNYLLQQNDIIFTDSLPKNKLTDGLRLNLNARVESSFLDNIPTTNLITADGLDFTQMSTYGDLNRVRIPDVNSPSGYACEMEVLDGANINPAARCMFGGNTNMPSSGNAMVSIYAKFEGGPSSNIAPYVYNGSGTAWQQLLPLDGGSNYLTSEYRRFGIYSGITYNPGFSMVKGNSNIQTGQKVRWHSPQVELQTSTTPFVSGSRPQNTTWYDLSGYGNNFTPMNNMTFTGHSFDFNGIDSGVQDHISSYNPDGADSVLECLFKPMDLSGEQAIFSDNYGPEFGFWIHTNGKLRAVAYASMYADLEVGKWYHAVMNIDPGATKSSTDQTYVQLYLNGEYIGQSNANTGNGMNDQPFTLGYDYKSGSPTRYFSGSIAAASVYYGQFTQDEASQNYYGGPIVTDGLVLAMDAGNLVSYESGSTIAYSMTGSLSGSLVNSVGYTLNNGGGFDFDGINDHIDLGDQSSLDFTNGVFSIECWVYFPSSWTGGSQYPNLVSKGATAGWDTDGWALFGFRDWGGGKSWGLGIRNGATARIVSIGNRATDEYLHIVATLDGSTMKLYENGVQVSTNSQTINPASNNTKVYIGRDAASNYFPGKIANVKAYNKTLSDSEVLQNYNAQKARFI
jgi:hypothetical protein